MFAVGLNPYGLTYTLGLQGQGTPRANSHGTGLEGFLAIGVEVGARTMEIFEPWLARLNDAELAALRQRLGQLGMTPIISSGFQTRSIESCIRSARALGATLIRFALTPILCGDRVAAGTRWLELVTDVRTRLPVEAREAAKHGLTIGIENHQDFTSRELVAICEEAGPNVGIVYDTGNSFPVGEAPLDFTDVVADRVVLVQLKDYRVQYTDEGFRLVRCAIGDGAVPFEAIAAILGAQHASLPAVLEPGALEARHVRLLTADWWKGYAPKTAPELAACLAAGRHNRLPDDADYRTPWERQADGELIRYETEMIKRSVANMRARGIMGTEGKA